MEISYSNKSLGEDAELDFLWTSSSSAEQSTNNFSVFFGVSLTSTQKLSHILPELRQTEESDNVIIQHTEDIPVVSAVFDDVGGDGLVQSTEDLSMISADRLTSTQKLSHILPELRQTEESDNVIMQPTEDISMISAGELVNDPESNSLEDVGGDGLVRPTEDLSMVSAGDLENDLESNSLEDVGGDGQVQPTEDVSMISTGDPDWLVSTGEQMPMPQTQLTPENDIVRQSVPPRQVPLIDVPTYTHTPASASKGGAMVSCSDGNEYYAKLEEKKKHLDPTWTCKYRPNKGKKCTATIRERTSKDGLIYYERNKVAHITHADSGMNPAKARKFNADLKEEAKKQPWISSAQLYETKIMEIPIEERSTMKSIKSKNVTVRRLNNAKSGNVPKEPVALDFEVDKNFLASCGAIPDGRNFIREDIHMPSGRRHFIMYTELMRAIMSDVFTWWVDATFKVVKFPFTQLWAVHAFIKHEDCMKQVTVAFVLMSGKSTLDYEAVFEKLKEKCPSNKVNHIVGDFEAATWAGAKNVFKDQIKMKGCYFHFTQAVWRKIVNLKIAGTKDDDEDLYHKDPGTKEFCKKIMSLPLLPHHEIKETYEKLKSENTLGDKLEKLCKYFEKTWLNGKVFTPESWSWYGEAIRTNNDVEGFHRRLNTRAGPGGTLTFYKLCALLGAESFWIEYQRYEVLTNQLSRRVSIRQSEKQSKLFDLWSSYHTTKYDAIALINAIWEMAEPNKARELSVLDLVVAAEDDTNV